MQMFYNLIGRVFFSRMQEWERRRTAKTMTFVVGFSFLFALVIAKVIRMAYNHTH